jgi:hypothetical protein
MSAGEGRSRLSRLLGLPTGPEQAPRPRAERADRAARGPREDPLLRYQALDTPTLVDGPAVRHDPACDRDPRLVILMPHLDVARMSGGPNTAFQVGARVARAGISVRFAATHGPLQPDPTAVREHIRRVTGVEAEEPSIDLVEASAGGAGLTVGRSDVLMATFWPTAHVANAALAVLDADEFLYLVQDFEPGFYQWSTRYALAEATYAMPIRAIVNQPLLLEHLRASGLGRFGEPDAERSVAFMPAVDRSVFSRRPEDAERPRRLVFYARPQNPRNLFELGLRALRVAGGRGLFDGRPWEFVAIGQPVPELRLSESHVLRSRGWVGYEDYGQLLGSSDLLLSLMLSPHTSYPPLEMAVAGGLVVTNTFGVKTQAALAAISPAIRAAPPDLERLVECLTDAVRDIDRDRGTDEAAVNLPDTWDAALADTIPWLTRQIGNLRRA